MEPCVLDLIQPVDKSNIFLTIEKEDSTILDEEKVHQESKDLEGAHCVKCELDVCTIDQPSMVHEVKTT